MLKVFSNTLFALTLLGFGFFVLHNAEAKSGVKLSKKYIPRGNPGGIDFNEDEDFAESYKLYEKRRELLKKKKLQGRVNARMYKEILVKKLKEKKTALLSNGSADIETCTVKDEKSAMVNQYGIDIARLKGAVFIDQYEDEQLKSKQQEEKKANTTKREKKISPINVTIGDIQLKKTCSHDFVTDLNNSMQQSLNSLSSFESVVGTAK